MTHTLIQKLAKHLSVPIKTECGVVYLLSGIRKLVENDQPPPRPSALWMYCNWALHINLSGSGTTLHFLKKVDDFIIKTVSGFQDPGTFSFLAEYHLFREFVYLDTFRDELRDVLKTYSLPMELSDDDKRWFSFVGGYAGVIEDGSLSALAGSVNTLQSIVKVTLSKGAALPAKNHVPFTIQWDIVLKDGRICRMEVDAVPKQKQMSHSMTLISAPVK